MQFCTHPYGQAQHGHEFGNTRGAQGFITKLGGWKKLETLMNCLLASGLDVAMAAAEYEFFR